MTTFPEVGTPADGGPWAVDVEDPRTGGASWRIVVADGGRQHLQPLGHHLGADAVAADDGDGGGRGRSVVGHGRRVASGPDAVGTRLTGGCPR